MQLLKSWKLSKNRRIAVLVGPVGSRNGEFSKEIRLLKKRGATLIAVDGGLDFFHRARLLPDFAIGDWDSSTRVSKNLLKTVPHRVLEREKDESDLRAAIREVEEDEHRTIAGFGFLGGRLDHQLGVFQDFSSAKIPSGIFSNHPKGSVFFLNQYAQEVRLRVSKGATISLMSLSNQTLGVQTKGLKYALDHETLKFGTRGLSNVAIKQEIFVGLRSGRLAVFVNEESDRGK